MNWIRIVVGIKADPRVHSIAEDCCKNDIGKAVGHVVNVLVELPAHARDGILAGVSALTLEEWALWRGKPGMFSAAFRAHLCDGDRVRGWDKHNGSVIREKDADRERKAASKRSGGIPPESSRNSNGRPPEKTRDGTGRDVTTTNSLKKAAAAFCVDTSLPAAANVSPDGSPRAAAAPPRANRGRSLTAPLLATVDAVDGPLMARLATDAAAIYAGLRRSHRDPDAFDAMLRAAVEPITGGVTYRWDEASAAIVQLRGSGREITSQILRGWMASARRAQPAPIALGLGDPWRTKAEELASLRARNEYKIDDCRPLECEPEPDWAAECDRRYPRGLAA